MMPRTLEDVSIDQLIVEHYLFDLGQSVEKTAEILDKDEGYVRKIHDDYVRFTPRTRMNK